jgi:hypothetical protein
VLGIKGMAQSENELMIISNFLGEGNLADLIQKNEVEKRVNFAH